MNLNNVTLELSGKAFQDNSEAAMREVCRTMFTQWRRLTDPADRISVLLWIADGSEILNYRGDLNQEFEWAYWLGCANPVPASADHGERQKRNTHHFPQKYRENIELRSYAWLKRLIEIIRETGADVTGKPIRVGAIFDNGPEFAVSDFKYRIHSEIAQGHTLYPGSFVTCNATLHADPQPYAGYPEGIPEGTQLGAFLGRQYSAFARDLGYDYLWLSNGMGFGTETWRVTGALFDGNAFREDRAEAAAVALLEFWQAFRTAAPDAVLETRGSNFSAGVEIASDGAPLGEIYRDFSIAPPVNSPWAALNYNSGLELAAWMSHVAELPGDYFPYRFYVHDPWFLNSPWLDRYGRSPWDIYQPLSICRIDADGHAQTPNSMAILTVDDSYGKMPDQVPDEVIPHLLAALREAPDQAGPLLWIYPFDEYNQRRDLARTCNEDLFLGEAIQHGLPLNSVISTANFRKIGAPKGTGILVAPVTTVEACRDALTNALARGAKLLVYGSLTHACAEVCELLGLYGEDGDSETGDCGSNRGRRVVVQPQYDGGGLMESALSGTRVLAQTESGKVLAAVRGDVGFVRSLTAYNAPQAFQAAPLMRELLAEWDWKITFQMYAPDAILPRLTLARHDNAFLYTIFAMDTTADLYLNTPLGAPVPTEMTVRLVDGDALWPLQRCLRAECRCFVKQQQDAVIACKIQLPAYPGYQDRRHYSGLRDAEVRFFPPRGCEATLEAIQGAEEPHFLDENLLPLEWEETPLGPCVLFRNVSGHLNIAW